MRRNRNLPRSPKALRSRHWLIGMLWGIFFLPQIYKLTHDCSSKHLLVLVLYSTSSNLAWSLCFILLLLVVFTTLSCSTVIENRYSFMKFWYQWICAIIRDFITIDYLLHLGLLYSISTCNALHLLNFTPAPFKKDLKGLFISLQCALFMLIPIFPV